MSIENNTIHKVVIIGSGPAGYTAALYAARATLNPVLFKGSAPNLAGGQLMLTSDVENYPGFPDGLLGPTLMENFEAQAKRFGTVCVDKNISNVDFSKRPFTLSTEDGDVIHAHSVIIATGANAKLLDIPLEKELMAKGAGVSACATCDGAFYKNVDVAVIGGGDSAMEEALFLTRYARSVTIIHRREHFRASKIMTERAEKNPKIKWMLNYVVDALVVNKKAPLNQESLSGLKLRNTVNNSTTEIAIDGLFVAIGHEPSTKLFENKLALDQKGYINTQAKSSKTEIAGVFACGDVQDSIYRQAITAAGSGCMAAMDAERYLEDNNL
jgi:thioredoxin reductase (NADPH)